jgi:hypothetical protein
MALKADPVARLHGEALHLVAPTFHDVLEAAPRTGLEAGRTTDFT